MSLSITPAQALVPRLMTKDEFELVPHSYDLDTFFEKVVVIAGT